MKRAYQLVQESSSGTPKSGRLQQKQGGVRPSSAAKRQKQCSLRAFLDSPMAGIQNDLKDTPPGTLTAKTSSADWPSTAQRQLENFTLDTPVGGLADSQVKPRLRRQLSLNIANPSRFSPGTADDDDDFKLFSSQTYSRISSFDEKLLSPEEVTVTQEICNDTAQLSVKDIHPSPGPTPTQPATAVYGNGSQVTDTQGAFDAQSSQSGQPAVTPELLAAASSDLKDDEPTSVGQAQRMFDIFRPKTDRKYLCIVRHGESEYNRAVMDDKGFGDPMIFDPKLTQKGHLQARELKTKLGQVLAKHGGDALWVMSPLTRCLQTFLEACPLPDRIPARDGKCDNGGLPLKIEILSDIAEFLGTAGDVGRPVSHLIRDFPQLSSPLSKLPERWWYQDPSKPNCAISRKVESFEPKQHRLHRVAEFSRWLNSRPEQLIVLVGHCSFWHAFLGKRKKLANCEMVTMYW